MQVRVEALLTCRTFSNGWKVPPLTGAPMEFRFTLLKLRSLQCVPEAIYDTHIGIDR